MGYFVSVPTRFNLLTYIHNIISEEEACVVESSLIYNKAGSFMCTRFRIHLVFIVDHLKQIMHVVPHW